MGFFENILKSLFGSKSEREMKKLDGTIARIKTIGAELEGISNDELRARSAAIRASLAESVQGKRDEIAEIRKKIEETEFDQREPMWKRIDELEKKVLDILEDKLLEVLPEVFAIVKDTARRFAANETLTVTATDLDRELAAQGRDFVHIDGDQAVYQNHWVAGGNEITWDMVHYDVQLKGGIVLHQGKIAEMATGEGKTLVATLPVFLNALTGNGVHVVTVNDYLARRDSEWMGPIYMFHGLTVACIDKTQPNSPERRAAYNCDITFGTNNEFGFDYLRDNMVMRPEDMVQRSHLPHNYAIVDEVDSVLIDDARTPLIISGPFDKDENQMFDQYKDDVERVYEAQRKLVTQLLTDAKAKIKSDDKDTREEGFLLLFRAFKGLPKYRPLIKFLSEEGIKAGMRHTEEYYMQDNNREMHVVTDPLYFIIEEQQNTIELTDKGIDVLSQRVGDSQFFVLPDIAAQLSAVTNENLTEEQKLQRKDQLLGEYAVKAERVHTVNQLFKAYTLFNRDDEYIVTDDGKVMIVDEQTGRIMEGRRYSDGLHQAIEAKEGVKVEAATQTVATITLQNYFRMYHKLAGMTGTAMTEEGEFWDIYKLEVISIETNKPVQRIDEPDRVYRTQAEKFNAVIQEIEKMREAGRPCLVGTTSVEISEKLSRMLRMRKIPHNVLNAKLHQKEAEIVAQAGRSVPDENGHLLGVVTIATNMAGRGTDIKLTPEVKAAGGLAIIGTERHESRRVDRQLRGRAGRQGDPGSSVFFVSFEDKVMRMFISNSMVKLLDKLGMDDGEPLSHPMVTSSIENAQKRVEQNHFGIRKHLVDYDDVMNRQRNGIYGRRHNAVMGERIGMDIANMIEDTADALVERYGRNSYEDLRLAFLTNYAIEFPLSEDEYARTDAKELFEVIRKTVMEAFNQKMQRLKESVNAGIQQMGNAMLAAGEQPHGMTRVPITDGKRRFGFPLDVAKSFESQCKDFDTEWEKAIILITIDEFWKTHLREMDQLRQSVQNASYEQKDPLVIYKDEAFHMFEAMVMDMSQKTIATLMRGQLYNPEDDLTPEQRRELERRRALYQQKMARGGQKDEIDMEQRAEEQRRVAQAGSRSGQPRQAPTPVVAAPKVGRNDPCPCGSGKKYKNCHGRGL